MRVVVCLQFWSSSGLALTAVMPGFRWRLGDQAKGERVHGRRADLRGESAMRRPRHLEATKRAGPTPTVAG